MLSRTAAKRILKMIVTAPLALLLFAFAAIQFQQRLFRYRAEHLLADFQSIRLHQSTWSDAQALMHRWGAWGHYNGQCSASDCAYTIKLSDVVSNLFYRSHSERAERFLGHVVPLYEKLGGRVDILVVHFIVQDRTIWRSSVWLRLQVPPHAAKDDDHGYLLLLSARASDSLHRSEHGPWILGNEEQLAQHPDYKAGRPGGCEICMSAEVTFTPFTAPSEIKTLTAYDLSCLTRYRPCLTLPDVLPVARDWHFYPSVEKDPEPPLETGPPKPCDIPLFTLGRDATHVMVVDVISVQTRKESQFSNRSSDRNIETAKIHVLHTLKGIAPWAPQEVVDATPQPFDFNFPKQAAEHFERGKKYIVLSTAEPSENEIYLNRCGVFEDSPLVRSELQKGFAQNDTLRHNEEFGSLFW
jgi:hypothetical protein